MIEVIRGGATSSAELLLLALKQKRNEACVSALHGKSKKV